MPRLFTKNGHDFFVVSSLLQKALRRGDVTLAAKACVELLPKYSNYCWKRLLTVSAEDCAGPITVEILALQEAWQIVQKSNRTSKVPGRAEGRIFFAKAIVLLAKAKHSRDQDELLHLVVNRMPDDVWEAALREAAAGMTDEGPLEIPEWVYDKHTAQGRRQGATLEMFVEDEHEALDNATPSIFANFRQMLDGAVQGRQYVEPEYDFGD